VNIAERFKVTDPSLALAHCLAALDESGPPPTERLIFPAGEFKTTKGTFIFDDEAAHLVMDDWQEWTGGLPQKGSSDYEHDQAKDFIPGHMKLDSSSYDLEIIEGGLWAVNIRWTDLAAGMISKREKRFTSPWWLFEKASRRIVRYINFGLVSLPATIAQPELVAAAASVQVPESFAACFAGYTLPVLTPETAAATPASENPEMPTENTPAATASQTPPPAPTPAPPPVVAATASYKDPNYVATMHCYGLRYAVSTAMENMMVNVQLAAELPVMAAAIGIAKHCGEMADHVAKCAAALAENVPAGEEMDDDAPDSASIMASIERLPAEVKTKVEAAVAACKANKCGGLLQKAHAAALATVGAKRFDKGALSALRSTHELVTATYALTKESTPVTAQAALAAMGRDMPALRDETAAAQAAEAKAKEDAEKAKAEAKATAAAADQKEYDNLIEANRNKVPKGADEQWVRAHIKADEAAGVTASQALAAYLKAKRPVTISVTHEQGAAGGATAANPATQDAAQREAVIAATEPDALQLAAWATTGGGPERLRELKIAKAKTLGLIS
jgi:hypothetical protein